MNTPGSLPAAPLPADWIRRTEILAQALFHRGPDVYDLALGCDGNAASATKRTDPPFWLLPPEAPHICSANRCRLEGIVEALRASTTSWLHVKTVQAEDLVQVPKGRKRLYSGHGGGRVDAPARFETVTSDCADCDATTDRILCATRRNVVATIGP